METFRPPRGEEDPGRRPLVQEPEGPLTLGAALALALAGSPELEAFSWEVRAGEARMVQASLSPNPVLSLEPQDVAGTGDYADGGGAEITLQAARLFELGGKRAARMNVAELERDSTAWDYEAKRIAVFSQTAGDFLDVLREQQRLELAGESVRLAAEVASAVGQRAKAAATHAGEVTKAEMALAAAEVERDQVALASAAARRKLAANWGSLHPKFDRAEGRLEAVGAIPSWEQVAGGLARSPHLARRATEIMRREAAVRLAEADAKPDITVGGGLRRKSDTGDSTLVLGVSMPLPLFHRNQGSIEEAQAALARSRAEQRALEVRVTASLAQAHGELAAAHARSLALRDRVVPLAQRAFDQVHEHYRAGRYSHLEVLEAQRSLFSARTQLLGSITDYHRAALAVERLTGEPLPAPDRKP